MKNKFSTLILSIFCLAYVAQCGESDALSSKVDLTLVPQDPIVVNAELTLNPGTVFEQTIPAPWFLFRYSINNGSVNELTLVTYNFRVSGVRNGIRFTEENSIDPSGACQDTTNNFRSFLAIIPAGQSASGVANGGLGGCDPTLLITQPSYEGWYIGLPEADNFFFTVDVEATGWFEDANGIPIERLDLFDTLFTQ